MPLTYQAIASHPRVLQLYSERLQSAGAVTAAEVDGWQTDTLDQCVATLLRWCPQPRSIVTLFFLVLSNLCPHERMKNAAGELCFHAHLLPLPVA